MKIQDMFVGQFVEIVRDKKYSPKVIPEVGWVVGLELKYQTSTLISYRGDRPVEILPSVQFVGEKHPRGVHPGNLQPYKG